MDKQTLVLTVTATHSEASLRPFERVLQKMKSGLAGIGFSDIKAVATSAATVTAVTEATPPSEPAPEETPEPVAVLPFDPSGVAVKELRKKLPKMSLSAEELKLLIDAELAGKNRDTAVRALKQARDKVVG